MRDIKNWLLPIISVETTSSKEDSPYPEISHEEQVQSDTKKIMIDSTVTEKIEKKIQIK
jgi:hypothetical protein